MRTARPVGLSQDGRSLIVATSDGGELAIPVDDRLHAALRGDQPRLGQLEIEMENALGPRDIQSRIRSGQSLEEVGRAAGIPMDRVERFAAPVLAEREHIALLAMSASVRKRGETSGHRILRQAVGERLQKRGVDVDAVEWDAFRLEDGHWSVSADYRSGESNRRAEFVFDLRGRFSVAANDEARWLLGEQSSVKGPQPGRRRPEPGEGEGEGDTEPTLDLSDELALVRVIQPDAPDATVGAAEVESTTPAATAPDRTDATSAAPHEQGEQAPIRGLHAVPDRPDVGPGSGVSDDEGVDEPDEPDEAARPAGARRPESPLETLSKMLDADEEDAPVYGGLNDASAVPRSESAGLRRTVGWEPGIVVDYPVEPGPDELDEVGAQQPGGDAAPSDEVPADQSLSYKSVFDDQAEGAGPPTPLGEVGDGAASRGSNRSTDGRGPHGTDIPAPPPGIVDGEDRAEEAAALEEEQAPKKPAPKPAGKRKRAAVPSWDEIMFGGPSRPS